MAKPTSRIDLGSLGIFKSDASQLRGDDAPAKLPGYLDDSPRPFATELNNGSEEQGASSGSDERRPVVPVHTPTTETLPSVVQMETPQLAPVFHVETRTASQPYSPRRDEHRTQVNLSSDTKAKLKDLVHLLVDQSKESGITQSDIIQALILALHDSRFEWNLGALNRRGPWGSALARSFPYELARIFSDSISRVEVKKRGAVLRPTG